MVLTEIIFKYLQTNRRITVPALGTFLSKGDGEPLLFSEFMKDDDGVLRELLASECGMSELEAAVFIDRFVFDLRHAVENSERYAMPHLGYMSSEDGRTFSFEFNPSADESSRDAAIEAAPVTPKEEVEEPQIEEEATETIIETLTTNAEEQEAEEEEYTEEDEDDEEYETEEEITPKRKFDWWMVIGIVAAIFALFAISYGVLSEWSVGNISFGDPIDLYLEKIADSDFWYAIQDIISPDLYEQAPIPTDVIPQDTIYM